jgi:hypothetical protein
MRKCDPSTRMSPPSARPSSARHARVRPELRRLPRFMESEVALDDAIVALQAYVRRCVAGSLADVLCSVATAPELYGLFVE